MLWNKEIRPAISGITCKITPALGLGVDKSTSHPSLCERGSQPPRLLTLVESDMQTQRNTSQPSGTFFGAACPGHLVEGARPSWLSRRGETEP